MRKKLKADDLVPEGNDYLRDLGSRRSKRPEEVKDNDTLDVDDLGGTVNAYLVQFCLPFHY